MGSVTQAVQCLPFKPKAQSSKPSLAKEKKKKKVSEKVNLAAF
jgi:hypothetical protein